MVKVFTFLFFLSIAVVNSKGQDSPGNYAEYLTYEKRFNKTHDDLEGTPYFVEKWLPGVVTFKNNYHLTDAFVRYDAYSDAVEVRLRGVEYTVKPDDLKEFMFEDPDSKEKYFFKKFDLAKKDDIILRVLSEGKVTFGANYRMRRSKGVSNGVGYEVLNPAKDRLLLVITYYFVEEGECTKVWRTRKSFLKNLPSHADEVEKYLDSNNLDVKNDEDLVKVMAYYNNLEQ